MLLSLSRLLRGRFDIVLPHVEEVVWISALSFVAGSETISEGTRLEC